MAELEAQIVRIRVPASVWAIAYHIVKSGRDVFTQGELRSAACGGLDTALANGLIEKLENGLYKANIELAKFYASLLPKVPKAHLTERKGRFRVSEEAPCEERQEALRLARAWAKLANWAEVHAEDEEEPPKEIVEVLERHNIEVKRVKMPNGAKVAVAKVLNYYIVMDLLMAKNTPKCAKYSRLGPNAWLCASTKSRLFSYLVPLASAERK